MVDWLKHGVRPFGTCLGFLQSRILSLLEPCREMKLLMVVIKNFSFESTACSRFRLGSCVSRSRHLVNRKPMDMV
jgi:hypothetical protein